MHALLPWLTLPLVVAVALVPDRGRGTAVARVILVGFALATLVAGGGTLRTDMLVTWADASASRGQFISISLGVLLGGLAPWPPRDWRRWVAGVPLAAYAIVALGSVVRPWQVILGAILGAVPIVLGRLVPRRTTRELATPTPHRPVLAAAAVVSLLVAVALVLFTDASIGASMLLLASVVAFVAPWPLHRYGLGVAGAALATLIAWLAANQWTAVDVPALLPVLMMVLVPSGILAAWRGWWANALGTTAVLAALHPGLAAAGAGAVALAAASAVQRGTPLRVAHRIRFPVAPVPAVLTAVAVALTVPLVLRNEVVLTALLAVGWAMAATRPMPDGASPASSS